MNTDGGVENGSLDDSGACSTKFHVHLLSVHGAREGLERRIS